VPEIMQGGSIMLGKVERRVLFTGGMKNQKREIEFLMGKARTHETI